MTTPIDTAELRRLLDSATPGPWCVHPNGTSAWQGEDYDSSGVLPGHGMVLRGIASAATERELADVDLAVALRNAAPALLDAADECDRMRAEVARLREALRAARDLASDRERFVRLGPRGFMAVVVIIDEALAATKETT